MAYHVQQYLYVFTDVHFLLDLSESLTLTAAVNNAKLGDDGNIPLLVLRTFECTFFFLATERNRENKTRVSTAFLLCVPPAGACLQLMYTAVPKGVLASAMRWAPISWVGLPYQELNNSREAREKIEGGVILTNLAFSVVYVEREKREKDFS